MKLDATDAGTQDPNTHSQTSDGTCQGPNANGQHPDSNTQTPNFRVSLTRTGKIARLPREVREELNQRLDDGERGPSLLAWLNDLPAVKSVIDRDYAGRPVTTQNLSHWRQGGFQDWQRQQATRKVAQRLAEQAQAMGPESIGDQLARVFAVQLYGVLEQLLAQDMEPQERFARLQAGLREIATLRRGDVQSARVRLAAERWAREQEREREEQAAEAEKQLWVWRDRYEAELVNQPGGELFGPERTEMVTKELGGDALARQAATLYVVHRQEKAKRQQELWKEILRTTNEEARAKEAARAVDQGKSRQVKPVAADEPKGLMARFLARKEKARQEMTAQVEAMEKKVGGLTAYEREVYLQEGNEGGLTTNGHE